MRKHYTLLLASAMMILFMNSVEVALANPIPWDPTWQETTAQYASVAIAELLGLLVGIVLLAHFCRVRWQRATVTVSVALIVSYALGVAIWTLAYAAGIMAYNPLNPFINISPHPLGTVFLLLPEIIGTVVGAIIIYSVQKVNWKKALTTMAAAMLVSFTAGILITNIYVHVL